MKEVKRSQLIDETLKNLIELRSKETIENSNDYLLDGLKLVGGMEEHLQVLSKVYGALYLTYRKDNDRIYNDRQQLDLHKGEISNNEDKQIQIIFRELLKITTKIFAGLIDPYDSDNRDDLEDLKIKIIKQGNPVTINTLLSDLKSFDY